MSEQPHVEDEWHGEDVSDQVIARLQKMNEWRAEGKSPYGGRFDFTHQSADVLERFDELDGTQVSLAGRLLAMRGHGKASFADLQDETGRLQLYARRDGIGPELYEDFRRLDIGDIIGVEGTTFRTKRGEISVEVKSFELLAKALRPLPEKWHGLKDVELRYRMRYLDLISNPSVREIFEARSATIDSMREFLVQQGFLEVETPVLHPIAGGANARPFSTYHNALEMQLYLRIAPELYLKRLLVGGINRVFEIGKNFRNEGTSTRHNPEFTAMEAYWAYVDFTDMMELTETLLAHVATAVTGSSQVSFGEMMLDFTPPWPRIPMAQLVAEKTGIEFLELDEQTARAEAAQVGVSTPKTARPGEVLNMVFEELVESTLVQPTFVTHHPVEISPLAKRSSENPKVTDRFEAFVNSWEIANGFSELNDPIDQRERFEDQMRARELGDDEAHLLDEEFVKALEYGMPPAAGLGIGLDRLVMLLTNAPSIREVLFFPHMRSR